MNEQCQGYGICLKSHSYFSVRNVIELTFVFYFSDLEKFVENSLDIYRHELALILYPVFVHMYLELVYNQHEEEAKRFIQRLGSRQESYYQVVMSKTVKQQTFHKRSDI